MPLERLKDLLVDLPQFALFELQPNAEVDHRVKVETDMNRVVPGLHKALLVLLDQVLKI